MLIQPTQTAILTNELLTLDAIKLDPQHPFQHQSGLMAPIYTDIHATIGRPPLRQLIVCCLADLITTRFPEATVIMSPSTPDLPYAALVAEALALPLVDATAMNDQPAIRVANTDHVVLLTDVITTGNRLVETAANVRHSGATVSGLATIFDYQLPDVVTTLTDHDVAPAALITYSHLLAQLVDQHALTRADKLLAKTWQHDRWHWRAITL
ncbi:orotate phosphoribosyltransferase [Furfurilactobacillus entadae]|uniref:orotate phosphoribosyltransferase n=1 Tax=Furfurilactobacillus entadae TaxID=2922307 RepID=UPI0035E93F62